MLGFGIASLLGLFGLTSAFALVALVLMAWMAWRIVAKAGLPGWLGLIAVLLSLTGIGAIVPVIALWVFAYMGWPRDDMRLALPGGAAPAPSSNPNPATPAATLPPPMAALPDRRGWQLSGTVAGGSVSLTFDGSAPAYLLTGAAASAPNELCVPDPSVASPHARLLIAGTRLGLEDLGSAGGTFIDGARLLPEHGPREISAARKIRLGGVELALSKA
jgi:FHA domain